MSKIATRSKTAIETKIEENELEIDIYDLDAPLEQIEEIVKDAVEARSIRRKIGSLTRKYKPLNEKVSKFLVSLGSPKKVNGPSFAVTKKERPETTLDPMKLVKEEGVSVEAIERCTVTKTVTYYTLTGIKGEEKDEGEEIENGEGE